MPILGSSNTAANKDMISKIWTNGDTIICLLWAISALFSKTVGCWIVKMIIYGVKGLIVVFNWSVFNPFPNDKF